MKKSRPGFLLSVLTDEERKDDFSHLLPHLHVGIRETLHDLMYWNERPRKWKPVMESSGKDFPWVWDRKKNSSMTIAAIARKENLSIKEIRGSL